MYSNSRKWYRSYSIAYLAIVCPCVLLLLIGKKTLLWGTDSFAQQYTVLRYTGRYIRALLQGNASMINYSIGQGLDTLGTLGYYGLTDPMQWIAAFLPEGTLTEIYYHFLIFLYIYLSGLLFGVFVRKVKITGDADWAVTVASLMYAFSGYASIGIIKNPYYGNGPVYLALMLIAVERVFESRKWLMMTLVTALMLISNFYIAFSTTLLVVIYIIVRLAYMINGRGVRKCAADGFTLLGSYLLGVVCAMVVLLPTVFSFLISKRIGTASGYTASLFHYPLTYYIKLLALFCAPYDYAGYWSLQSFCPLALFCIPLLFAKRKETVPAYRRILKTLLVIGFIFLCMPIAGKIFNGLGYVTNRWTYGWGFIVCAASTAILPELFRLDAEKKRRYIGVFGLIWALFMLAYAVIEPKLPQLDGAGNYVAVTDFAFSTARLAAVIGAAALIIASLFVLFVKRNMLEKDRLFRRVIAILTAVCCFGYFGGYIVTALSSSMFYKRGIDAQINSSAAAEVKSIEADGFWRADTGALQDNTALLLDYNGVTCYWSLLPSQIAAHYTELELSTQRWTFRTEGLGSDTILQELAAVRYSVRDESSSVIVPYNYSLKENGSAVRTYENASALPIGYFLPGTMSRQDYEKLDPIAKRLALLQCAVIDGADSTNNAEVSYQSLPWNVAETENAELSDHSFNGKKDGVATISFKGQPDHLYYIRLKGTRLNYVDDDTDLIMYLQCENGIQRMFAIKPKGVYNYDQSGICAALGYSESGMNSVSLKLNSDAELDFDQLEIISIPAQVYRDAVSAIKDAGNVELDVAGDTIEGTVGSENGGVVQIAVPYTAGWKAFVDGVATEIKLCGGMYMGLEIEPGTHTVRMEYETPGLKIGALISVSGVILTVLLIIFGKKRSIKG